MSKWPTRRPGFPLITLITLTLITLTHALAPSSTHGASHMAKLDCRRAKNCTISVRFTYSATRSTTILKVEIDTFREYSLELYNADQQPESFSGTDVIVILLLFVSLDRTRPTAMASCGWMIMSADSWPMELAMAEEPGCSCSSR